MHELKILAEWNNENFIWVASSQEISDLNLEAATIDELTEQLKAEIPVLLAQTHKHINIDQLRLVLIKSWPVEEYL